MHPLQNDLTRLEYVFTVVLAKTEWFSPVFEVNVGEALGLLSLL